MGGGKSKKRHSRTPKQTLMVGLFVFFLLKMYAHLYAHLYAQWSKTAKSRYFKHSDLNRYKHKKSR